MDINQEQQTNPIKDFITSPIKIGTYASMYATLPSMWNTQKGVWVPGIGRTLESRGLAKSLGRGIRMGGTTIRRYGKTKGSAMIAGETAKRVFSFGYRGGGYVGGKVLNVKNNIGRIEERIASSSLRVGFSEEDVKRISSHLSKSGKRRLPRKMRTGKGMDEILFQKSVYEKTLHREKRRLSKYERLLSRNKQSLKLAKMAKIGIGVGKAASIVGLAMFTYDMATMIGEPLGNMAMKAVDNMYTKYKERFMPETGGQLQLSYLSQGAYTERQKALQAISKSNLNARSGLGNEASEVHGMFG
jgi:hypothetical protein